jgi:hypothetical protein
MLVPQRHEQGDRALRQFSRSAIRGPWKANAAGREPDQSDKQVVQSADYDPDRNRYQQRGYPVIEPTNYEWRIPWSENSEFKLSLNVRTFTFITEFP